MLTQPLDKHSARQMFGGLMQIALTEGTPPPTDSGLSYEIITAIENVCAAKGSPGAKQAAADAREIFAKEWS